MSAFLVSDYHINVLINYGVHNDASVFYNKSRWHDIRNKEEEYAQELLNENYRSLNSRYGDKDEPHKIKFKRLMLHNIKAVDILKACDCYDYQACETKDYYESLACAVIKGIRRAAISKIPGYDNAGWGLDEPENTEEVFCLTDLLNA